LTSADPSLGGDPSAGKKRLMTKFGRDLWTVEGPVVEIGGFGYRTRMAVARLSDGISLWVWSPVPWTRDLDAEIAQVGEVRHIVSPNKLHHKNLSEWGRRFPDARVYAPPGLKGRDVVQNVTFTDELGDGTDLTDDFDQIVFRNQFTMEEVVFFHKPSKTALFCDLIQRYRECDCQGWRGFKRRWDGLMGDVGGTPREWVWSFKAGRSNFREAREKVVSQWKPTCMLIAHGECLQAGATPAIARALKWAEA